MSFGHFDASWGKWTLLFFEHTSTGQPRFKSLDKFTEITKSSVRNDKETTADFIALLGFLTKSVLFSQPHLNNQTRVFSHVTCYITDITLRTYVCTYVWTERFFSWNIFLDRAVGHLWVRQTCLSPTLCFKIKIEPSYTNTDNFFVICMIIFKFFFQAENSVGSSVKFGVFCAIVTSSMDKNHIENDLI